MNIAAVISLLTALFKAVPTIEEWWERLITAWISHKKNSIKKENRIAIQKAFENDDQRPIEETLGSETAGEYSGYGTVVNELPGVHQSKKD